MPSKNVVIVGVATWADEAPGDAHPEHPIYIPAPPNVPTHPIVLPPLPPATSDGVPTHPIYLPPYVSGGPIDPYPDAGLPAPQPPGGAHISHPIVLPGTPTHPIYIPDAPDGTQPPLEDWSWAWSPYYGWIVLPGPGEARPK